MIYFCKRSIGSIVAKPPSPTSQTSTAASVTSNSASPTNVLPTPSPEVSLKPAPDEFIREHYALLNNRDYQTAWNRLTPQFQNGANNYYGYVDWWESVSYIEVDRLTILEQHQDTAIVDANLLYHLKKGSTYRDKKPLIYLVWDRTASRWLINNKQAK